MHRIVFFTGLRVQPDRVELEPTTRHSSQSSRCVGANAFLALVAHWAFASLLPAQRALGSAQLTAAMRLPRSPVGRRRTNAVQKKRRPKGRRFFWLPLLDSPLKPLAACAARCAAGRGISFPGPENDAPHRFLYGPSSPTGSG